MQTIVWNTLRSKRNISLNKMILHLIITKIERGGILKFKVKNVKK